MKFTIPAGIPRAALITGGPAQRAIATALAAAGFAIALQCQTELDQAEGAALLPADLSDEAQTATLVERAAAAIGPLGVLVNGAGAHGRDTWDDATRATWDMHIETNLRAPLVLTQHFAKALPTPQQGVVINLLDPRIRPQLVSYTLSKAALWSLTQTMALALAPRIRVNGVVLGGGAPQDEIGRAVLAILALSSMTGQMIVPDGVPPPAA